MLCLLIYCRFINVSFNKFHLYVLAGGSGGAPVAVSAAPAAGGAAPAAAAPAAEEKKVRPFCLRCRNYLIAFFVFELQEEPKEESDEDMGFSLFD